MSNIDTKEKTQAESLKETGRNAYAAIAELVAALNCDYDRLAELREERDNLQSAVDDAQIDVDTAPDEEEQKITLRAKTQADAALNAWLTENGEELQELAAQAGDCEDRDEAQERIQEDALTVEVRSDWHVPGDKENASPAAFRILLATGGPAYQIRGELDENGEPSRAWLEVQDWGTPWTQYYEASQSVLLDYARCFYFS